jgi:Polyketide cyclase / dehydrase and lipid transport
MVNVRHFFLLPLVLGVVSAHAFEIEHSQASYSDRKYQYELRVRLDAPLDRVEAVLRDYERYPELDTRILEARVVERPADNVALLETKVRVCFGWFCRDVKRTERVEEAAGTLAAITDPARSDVKFGETHTSVAAAGEGTLVSYRTSIAPAFWIPSFVGRRWMLGTLANATNNLFMNVEERARHAATMP